MTTPDDDIRAGCVHHFGSAEEMLDALKQPLPDPAPAGPTTIPAIPVGGVLDVLQAKALRHSHWGSVPGDVIDYLAALEDELARERRRCEMLLKALREIAMHDTDDNPCEHLTNEGCRAWIEETAEEALKDAAKALQGQDGGGR
jgi:hypothetical protein